MDISVQFDGEVSANESLLLEELSEMLKKECSQEVELRWDGSPQGVKLDGLLVGIAVIGLGLAGIRTVLQVMTFWISQKPQYSITLERGDRRISISNMTHADLMQVAAQLEHAKDEPRILLSHGEQQRVQGS